MIKKIAITGSHGRIGKMLVNGLSSDYEIIQISTHENPPTDIKDYEALLDKVKNCGAIIHLAWDTKDENFKSKEMLERNTQMYLNVYKAAIEAGVKRVIMASSVHADDFEHFKGPGLMNPHQTPNPQSAYGAHKIKMEEEGKVYSQKGLEVVMIRFGAVDKYTNEENTNLWLDPKDLVSLIKTILNADKIPNNYFIMYAVSNNVGKIHDTKNPLGWELNNL